MTRTNHFSDFLTFHTTRVVQKAFYSSNTSSDAHSYSKVLNVDEKHFNCRSMYLSQSVTHMAGNANASHIRVLLAHWWHRIDRRSTSVLRRQERFGLRASPPPSLRRTDGRTGVGGWSNAGVVEAPPSRTLVVSVFSLSLARPLARSLSPSPPPPPQDVAAAAWSTRAGIEAFELRRKKGPVYVHGVEKGHSGC